MDLYDIKSLLTQTVSVYITVETVVRGEDDLTDLAFLSESEVDRLWDVSD